MPDKPARGVACRTLLRHAREQTGLTAAQISERTRIQLYKIEALENGDFVHLPDGIYLDGIVRAYARELALEPEPLIERLHRERPPVVQDSAAAMGLRFRSCYFSLRWAGSSTFMRRLAFQATKPSRPSDRPLTRCHKLIMWRLKQHQRFTHQWRAAERALQSAM